MRENKNGEFRSSVYTERPPYADFDAPATGAMKNS